MSTASPDSLKLPSLYELPPGISTTDLPLPLVRRGKVRDVYQSGDQVLLVSTDRLSAFDVVFPDPIPAKGLVLNQLSAFWFRELCASIPNHFLSDHPEAVAQHPHLHGRCTLGRPAQPLPVECVVRGTLDGSAYKDYLATGRVSGISLPSGLRRRELFPHPIFTPSTKADSGHDEPISFDRVVELVGGEVAETIRAQSLRLFEAARNRLLPLGILLGDTKFEFGLTEGGEILLIDEILTPDSSRFWEADTYGPDLPEPRSYDKQFVRDYVESVGWNKCPPAPRLPREVIEGTSRRYLEIFSRMTGHLPVFPARPTTANQSVKGTPCP
jgi:phosphoribosylaminoimidazole-succinocarboxamide synthase